MFGRSYRTRFAGLRGLSVQDVMAQQVGPQAGSNPGGVYRGTDGVERYIKFYENRYQAAGEVLANHLYNDLGLLAPDSELFEQGSKTIYASTMIPKLRDYNYKKSDAAEFLKGFAVDVLTMNWDVVGLVYDNIMYTSGGVCARLDNGASFLSRARGARKDTRFLMSVSEWNNYIHPPEGFYGAIENYGTMAALCGIQDGAEIPNTIPLIRKIVSLQQSSGGWDAYVAHNAPLFSTADAKTVVEMLNVRTDWMLRRVGL